MATTETKQLRLLIWRLEIGECETMVYFGCQRKAQGRANAMRMVERVSGALREILLHAVHPQLELVI